MRDTFHDLETYSEQQIQWGSYQYGEMAEVTIWSWAVGEGDVFVWDIANSELHGYSDIAGPWVLPLERGTVPSQLLAILNDPDALVWFHNGGQFDFPVLRYALPHLSSLVAPSRRRDTMAQAFAHALPGALDKLGEILNIDADKRKIKEGKKLVQLFCKPQSDAFFDKFSTRRATKHTHPVEWQRFIQYAGGDIVTMREAHKRMPTWNYKTGKQVDLCLIDWTINGRGFAVDLDLAEGAIRAVDIAKADLSRQTREATDGAVGATTQVDVLLKHILEIHGVELPNLQADTLERRMADPDLPEAVRELIGIRLQASMNSVSKYKTLMRGVSKDGRLRGCHQFRGAGRTGRWAHRMFQPGNLPRPTLPQAVIDAGIAAVKNGTVDLCFSNVMSVISNGIRGAIVAPPGKKLVVADLSNIEGRAAAWLAGEEWKLKAFRDFDNGIGHDLYIVAYAKSFNVDPATIGKKSSERQIGKVEELMFQYGGGVGAWITGAATYGIDLDQMTEQVYDTLPAWAVDEARNFLNWLYSKIDDQFKKKFDKAAADGDFETHQNLITKCDAANLKARYDLPERTFITCDAIKRLWRTAHPRISSYWKEIEDTVREAMDSPGVTFPCRRVKIRRDGAWLRIGLPSGRALCYPNPNIEKDGSITYTGLDQYTRQWGRVSTFGGKLFENCIAENTLVLTEDGWLPIQNTGNLRVWDGIEWVSQKGCIYKGKQHTLITFNVRMTPDHQVLTSEGWCNASSCERHHRAGCRIPDGYALPFAVALKRGVAFGASIRRVYDLVDCGPRRRFVVAGSDGEPLIVHNCTQAVACDQFAECFDSIEQWIAPDAFIDGVRQFETEEGIVLHVHDEIVAQVPDIDNFTADQLSGLMCADLGWNEGLPLAAAGFETYRYKKE